jgi:hypothetical protein
MESGGRPSPGPSAAAAAGGASVCGGPEEAA